MKSNIKQIQFELFEKRFYWITPEEIAKKLDSNDMNSFCCEGIKHWQYVAWTHYWKVDAIDPFQDLKDDLIKNVCLQNLQVEEIEGGEKVAISFTTRHGIRKDFVVST